MDIKIDDATDMVSADDKGKWDEFVPQRHLSLSDGRLTFPQAKDYGWKDGLGFSSWALSQACKRLAIPTAYFKKCPTPLQDCQFNHWLREGDSSLYTWYIRAKESTVRGVLSNQYVRVDNSLILSYIRHILTETPYKIALCQITEEAFHLRLVNQQLFHDVRKDDRLMVGIHISNSEVGFRAVTIEALVYRLICTNGLIRRLNSESIYQRRHIGYADDTFHRSVGDAIINASVVAASFLEKFAQTSHLIVPNPETAVSLLAKSWSLPKSTEEHILVTLAAEKKPNSLYSLVNGITATAQKLSIEDRYALEVNAGQLIEGTGIESGLRRRILSPEDGGERWPLMKIT